jgi:hypothetical protein
VTEQPGVILILANIERRRDDASVRQGGEAFGRRPGRR